jgi:2-oxo-3-hexenedioate decarboxylase/2-keto-4-pentenoate hydratase
MRGMRRLWAGRPGRGKRAARHWSGVLPAWQDAAQPKEGTAMVATAEQIADYLMNVRRTRVTVGWWPKSYMPADERAAYAAQDAYLKRIVPEDGEVVGYKIGLTAPAIWAQTGLRSPAYGPIRRNRVFEGTADLKASQHTRLGLELEIILTVNADVPAPPAGKPYDKDSISPYIASARAGFELIEDRGADYSRLSALHLILDVGWNWGSLLAPQTPDWRKLDLANLKGTVSFDGEVVASGSSGDVMGHCVNSLAWVANKLAEHGKQLKKGMIVSTGSMVACQFVPVGTTAVGRIDGLGEVTVNYTF